MSQSAKRFNPPPRPRDGELIEKLDELIRTETGVEPNADDGKRIREILHTGLKLVDDGADLGELKLISRSLKELRYALKVFRKYQHVRKVSIFGSARIDEDSPAYQAAVAFSQRMAAVGWMVITGAGDGIMRAGHGGAGREASFGVAIRLPFETSANDVIAGDDKLIVFRYFFTRKLIFMWQAHAVTLFPGGFGTHDEGFEALTLVQTGKAPMVPIVMVDAPGGRYWKQWDRYVREQLLAADMISPQDLSLYHITDDPADAVRHIQNFYRNYHSQRFVQDVLVIRMQRPLTASQLAELNNTFGDLVAQGRIEQGRPLEAETEELELPRLHFTSTRRSYGRLRQLIDRINAFDMQNHPELPEPARKKPPAPPRLEDRTAGLG